MVQGYRAYLICTGNIYFATSESSGYVYQSSTSTWGAHCCFKRARKSYSPVGVGPL